MRRSVYLFSDGQISRQDNTLVFETSQGKKFIPVEQVGEVHILGEVNATKKLLELATQNEILLHYYDHYGYYVGTYYPREHYNSGYMILRQAECYLDDVRRLDLARRFVAGAYSNIDRVLSYYVNRGIGVQEVQSEVASYGEQASTARDVEELMAIEGNMRSAYYSAFDLIIRDPDFAFDARSRRPPRNELNAMISFGNSLVYTGVLSQIYRTHLDPRIGYLHATNFRSFSLNLDVAEIFKPIIVDRVIFSMINHRMIRKSDFDEQTGGVLIKDAARKAFVSEMDKRFETVIKVRSLSRMVTYRTLIRMELYKIEKHLMGEKEYEPFCASW